MITSFLYKKSGEIETNLSRARLLSALSEKDSLLWVDFENPTEFESDSLVEIFNFHPLAVEDCILDHSEPKVDDYEEYLFLVVHALTMLRENGQKELSTIELNLFLGPNYVVTFHKEPIESVTQDILRAQQKPAGIMGSGADLLVHTILDHLVDRYLPVFHQYEDKADLLEKDMFDKSPSREKLATLLQLKQDISTLRRIVGPQRDTLHFLTRNAGRFIKAKHLIYFRDISDHLFRIASLANGMYDHLTSMMEVYFSYLSSELNVVMKRLTVVATLTMPAVMIASIYGMNFREIPYATHQHGFWGIMIFTAIVTGVMAVWMRIKKWM
ncbi:MAG: magnesium/cobalt transporter CorA [Candidatus Omnitrophica bacterium]|nr:magnesium/cobalt transporter CorA [Candidatus Omnitrophota bacterium]